MRVEWYCSWIAQTRRNVRRKTEEKYIGAFESYLYSQVPFQDASFQSVSGYGHTDCPISGWTADSTDEWTDLLKAPVEHSYWTHMLPCRA